MDFKAFFSIEGLIVAAAFYVFGLFTGANNPEWVSAKWREIRKAADQAKEAEGRKQLWADFLAEAKRQGLLKE